MGLGLSLGMRQEQSLQQVIQLPFEHSGELELLSLHRIRYRIPTLQVHNSVRRKLVGELFRENAEYRRKAKNKKMCITPDGLDNSVDSTHKYLVYVMNQGIQTLPPDNPRLIDHFKTAMSGQVDDQTRVIRKWFADNYDNLIYNTDSKIPYPIIMKMREKLTQWSLGETNPFDQPIEDLIEETMKSRGLNPSNYNSPEEMWAELKAYSG